ncbi:N-acetyltransferase DgcN [Pseudoalteromonas sp. MMG005]|uniref:N-acetyltransferase DgcN n=1 Tax=Pseudoalteromonas sp. MMG005 TaxID=2822682 RepID=UPI001B39FBD6|nr:N-acetyltransferase DgcN [Pseudoalteromonas sp. MMG005]MBQ4846027.1 DUF1611 domain-containing protein [Pseudoalteromonas sp. MMG005]
MIIQAPYLVFLGDATDKLSIKMAQGVADWRTQHCVGEMSVSGCSVTTGLKQMDITTAASLGAKTFVLGFANSGGYLEPKWLPYIRTALRAGMDVVSGLHDRLIDIDDIRLLATQLNKQLIDIRHPQAKFQTGTGVKRSGKRLLTVGTDCSVGKMYTSLAIEKHLQASGVSATIKATGQCGILIAGEGVAIDCVASDFISGAVEQLSPSTKAAHWDIIEGQGSLSHPAFAGVSLGLLHGAQPDALIVCHALGRSHMRGLPEQSLPTIQQTIANNEQAARLTNPNATVIGVSVNTSSVSKEEGVAYCERLTEALGMPCVDPLRMSVGALVAGLPL